MSASSSRPRRRVGCLTRLLILVLFMGACYWLLLAPIPEGEAEAEQTPNTPTPETSSERVRVEGEVNSAQQAALEKMADETGEQVDVLGQNGQIRFLNANVTIPETVSGNMEKKAAYFLSQNAKLLQVENTSLAIYFESSSVNEQGITYLRYSQRYKGIPVYGSSFVLGIDPNNEVVSFSASYVPNLELDVQPKIRSVEAEKRVLSALGSDDAQLVGETTLVIYAPEIWDAAQTTKQSTLCWLVFGGAESAGEIGLHFVDAKSGEILDQISFLIGIGGNPDIEIWDAQGWSETATIFTRWLTADLVMNENGLVSGASQDPIAESIQRNAHTVYSYYWNTFGRDSYNNKGMLIKVYYNNDPCWPGWLKQPSIGLAGINVSIPVTLPLNSIFMCPEWAENIDAMAHEFTHGVIDHSSNLIYAGETAALDEAYADIFAAIIDTTDPWKLTKDKAGTQIRRRLDDPKELEKAYPINYSEMVLVNAGGKCPTVMDDPPCPHTNSTIWSHAFYQIAVGDSGREEGLKNVDIEKLQYVYYDTMINLQSGAGFKDAAELTLSKCEERSKNQSHGISLSDCETIRWVFAETGLVTRMTPNPAPTTPTIPTLPELPNLLDWFNNMREDLRNWVDDVLGDWSPIKLWNKIQEEIERIRNNYWVKLLECIKNSDQACIDRYAADLARAVWEAFVNFICSLCSSFFAIFAALFVAYRKWMM